MSTVSKREREQRRKLQHFLTDLALLGSLQGFQYFQPWLRGREELLLTVVNEDLGWRSPGFAVSAASSSSSSSSSSTSSSSSYSLASDASSPLPGDTPRLRYTHQPQANRDPRDPQGPRDPSVEAHLLPASPSEREIAVPHQGLRDSLCGVDMFSPCSQGFPPKEPEPQSLTSSEVNCTLFLLAGYAKYGHPYAWIRSNHERLVNIGGADSLVKDTPMKLKSVTDWQTQGVRVWDMVSELVSLCTLPSPPNPLALDLRYLESLPLAERFLVSGALLNFLETYAVHGNRDELHYDKVVEEVRTLRRLHVHSLLEVQRLRGPSRTRTSSSPPTQGSSER